MAVIRESRGWTIGAIMVGNLVFNGFLYFVANNPVIAGAMKGPHVVWSPAVITLLAAELAVTGLLVALTFHFRDRKTNFL